MVIWFEENNIMDKAKTSDNTREEPEKKVKKLGDKLKMKNVRKTILRNMILRRMRIMIFLRLHKRNQTNKKDGRKNSYFSK